MIRTIALAILSTLLVGAIIVQPDASFQASLQGLTVWWNIVFPGLLPFLVLFEIMLAFGLAHAMGALLSPFMRRLFDLPGEAALPVVVGWLGGFPAGAEAVATLRKRELISRTQGQRLLAFAHMPNPLFMLVIVGAGFLHKPLTGILITGAVWLSAVWLLFLASLFRSTSGVTSRQDPRNSNHNVPDRQAQNDETASNNIVRKAVTAMVKGRESDGRSLGKVLGDSVTASVQRLMMIGGFMIIASMIAKLAEPLFAPVVKLGLTFAGPALFEGHLGAYAAAVWELPGVDMAMVCAVIAAVLCWGGLSGIMQTGYSVSGTDLKLLPFVLHRLNHALHAFLLTLLLWHPVGALVRQLVPNAAFPVVSGGVYYDSSFGVRFPSEAIAASQFHGLWPYAAGSCVAVSSLFLLAWISLKLLAGKGVHPR